ncbi:Uncharacterised protein [Streptococcus dysgalactiae]|nr:Uncharacterised protein [Streptococcus dysgalactiae]
MVVIKKRSNVIPVDFGEFQLNFPMSDSNIKRMEEVGKELEARSLAIQGTDNKAAIDAATEFCERRFYTKSLTMKKHLILSMRFRVNQQILPCSI